MLLSRPFFRSRNQDRDRDRDKMNLSALESRDHGLEITSLVSSDPLYSKFWGSCRPPSSPGIDANWPTASITVKFRAAINTRTWLALNEINRRHLLASIFSRFWAFSSSVKMYSLRMPIWKHLLSRQRLQKRRLQTSMRHRSSYGHLKCSCMHEWRTSHSPNHATNHRRLHVHYNVHWVFVCLQFV